ncbi:malto-oligosyltrehalose trehalohydrolase [Pelomicrobium sp.]|jgi:maltooligosyltrehalose trehalohydrolase|uniref:malto-oligosyltrehalose trehalohydrolase n=1 Tax=Pelomicrobium sp. TaxID=2815319 RepID=UPI002FDE81D6
MRRAHSMPFGAQVEEDGRTRFRLWAPSAREVDLELEGAGAPLAMAPLGEGWFERTTAAPPGTRYRLRIDGGLRVPDPASRFNPDDVHGASEVVDPRAFDWPDAAWCGRPWEEAVLYELHVGAFSPEGTFAGVEARLDHLAGLGVTGLELMPVADFPGRRNWGYDGVLPFAPDAAYGRPEDLKRLVAAAHARGLMVLLDVVYNHFGPEGNYLHLYAKPFFSERHQTPWGAAINFDGPGSRVVRDFFIHNALYWIEEFHLDGLRLDAVHAIADDSRPDILEELAQAVRRGPGRQRHVHLVLENDKNQARYLVREPSGRPRWYDAQWNDDIHHAFHVLLAGERDGYYADYAEKPTWYLGRCLAEGFAYQGEPSPYRQHKPRGEPSAQLPPGAFVSFLQTHDQVGNRAFGERLVTLAPEGALRAATAAWLLAPSPPMLFMGEEFGAATPFLFFCDFGPDLAAAVTQGRRREFARFARFADPQAQKEIPDPNAEETFARSKLDWSCRQRAPHDRWLALYRRLLGLRRDHIVPRLAGMAGRAGVSQVLAEGALTARWRLGDASLLVLWLNLGSQPVAIGAPPKDAPFFAEPEDACTELSAGRLPAACAVWFLDTSGGAT